LLRADEGITSGERVDTPRRSLAASQPDALAQLVLLLNSDTAPAYIMLDNRIAINTQAIDTISVDGAD
jgi:hypothetical protein